MELQRIIQTGEYVGPAVDTNQIVDGILSEMSRLYFERFRALSSGDKQAFLVVDSKISLLKAKLDVL